MTNLIKQISAILPFLVVSTSMFILKNAILIIALYHLSLFFLIFIYKPQISTIVRGVEKHLLAATIVMMLIFSLLLTLFWNLFIPDTPLFVANLKSFGLNSNNWLLFSIYFCTVNPLLEETMWRLSFPQRNLPIDILFALYHIPVLYFFTTLPYLMLAFITLTAISFIWRECTIRYKGAAIPLIMHLLADTAVILVVSIKIVRLL